jgi:hypothetical protein
MIDIDSFIANKEELVHQYILKSCECKADKITAICKYFKVFLVDDVSEGHVVSKDMHMEILAAAEVYIPVNIDLGLGKVIGVLPNIFISKVMNKFSLFVEDTITSMVYLMDIVLSKQSGKCLITCNDVVPDYHADYSELENLLYTLLSDPKQRDDFVNDLCSKFIDYTDYISLDW